MISNVELTIEQFDNGYCYKWSDLDGELTDSRCVKECDDICDSAKMQKCLEELVAAEIASDVTDVMNKCAVNKVRLSIHYEPIDEYEPVNEKLK